MTTPEPLSVLYLSVRGSTYRFKCFVDTLWIERQSPVYGGNLPFPRKDDAAYVETTGAWVLEELANLIEVYEALDEMNRATGKTFRVKD